MPDAVALQRPWPERGGFNVVAVRDKRTHPFCWPDRLPIPGYSCCDQRKLRVSPYPPTNAPVAKLSWSLTRSDTPTRPLDGLIWPKDG